MGEKVVLEVKQRKLVGKKVSKLRKEGLVPGVIYGEHLKSKAVEASYIDVQKVWRVAGRRQPIEVSVDGAKHLAMIKSADIDPVKHRIRHLGIHVVNKNEKVETEVPVKIKLDEGNETTPAERAGLVVLTALEKVEIEALPNDLPEAIYVNGEVLAEEGQHVSVSDLIVPKGVKVLTDPEIVIATVYEPSAIAAQNEETAGAGESPAEVESENGSAEPEAESKKEEK
ncbi:MAG TPA: 50S ribosomal protein L25 [Candidatus Saccharimonadales bacterium]|nr:50S ribosomal protein L25 [Candidatus Saccharimonadales bacterium]